MFNDAIDQGQGGRMAQHIGNRQSLFSERTQIFLFVTQFVT
jgi:DNA repair ATPase RecN